MEPAVEPEEDECEEEPEGDADGTPVADSTPVAGCQEEGLGRLDESASDYSLLGAGARAVVENFAEFGRFGAVPLAATAGNGGRRRRQLGRSRSRRTLKAHRRTGTNSSEGSLNSVEYHENF